MPKETKFKNNFSNSVASLFSSQEPAKSGGDLLSSGKISESRFDTQPASLIWSQKRADIEQAPAAVLMGGHWGRVVAHRLSAVICDRVAIECITERTGSLWRARAGALAMLCGLLLRGECLILPIESF